MTTTNPPDHAARLRDWAAAQLKQSLDGSPLDGSPLDGSPLDGSPRAGRADFLERLATAECCPTPAFDYAERVAAGGGDTCPANLGWQQAQHEIEKQLRGDVEQLAADWFSLAGRVRTRRLDELRAACRSFPNLLARLASLAPALHLDPAEVAGPSGQLARMIAELFVLAPRRRAERRREMLLELESEPGVWESAARDLKSRHGEWAALQPVFIESILAWKSRDSRARAAQKAYAKSLKQQQAATSEGVRWPWLVTVLVVLSLIRSASCSKQSSPPPPPRFEFNEPRFQPGNQEWKQDSKNKQFNENVQKLLSRKWRFEDGKLVPADAPGVPPRVKPASPPVMDPK